MKMLWLFLIFGFVTARDRERNDLFGSDGSNEYTLITATTTTHRADWWKGTARYGTSSSVMHRQLRSSNDSTRSVSLKVLGKLRMRDTPQRLVDCHF